MGEELSDLNMNQLKELENKLQTGLSNIQIKKVLWFKVQQNELLLICLVSIHFLLVKNQTTFLFP